MNPGFLETFIRDPHATVPGTTMPDVLARLDKENKTQAAEALTHFLLSLKKNDFSLQPPDNVAAQHGERLFHSRGCVACHSPRDAKGNELLRESSAPLGVLEKKYSFESLVEFLRRPHASRPSGRMPDLRLPGQDIERIAHYLLRDTRVPGHLAYTLYRGLVWEGLDSDEVEAERLWTGRGLCLEEPGHGPEADGDRIPWMAENARDGDHTFFLRMNGGSLQIDGVQIVSEEPSNRRGPKTSRALAELRRVGGGSS